MPIYDEKVKELEKIAKKLHYDIVIMIGAGKPGHLGGSCSIAEIFAVLYFHKIRHDPKNLEWPDRDRFLLSKGHAAMIQTDSGLILQGYPEMLRVTGIEANTGSFGQGFTIAHGMAQGRKIISIVYVKLAR